MRHLLLLLACSAACLVGLLGRGATAQVQYPLHVTADQRGLADAAGEPFLLNGDAAYSLMVQLNLADTELYLEDRRQRGFNTVLVNLIERGFGGPANQNGLLPFVPEDDYTSPNPLYFARAAFVVNMAATKGILVLLNPSYLGFGCGSQGWCQQMLDQSVDDMLEYGRYLGTLFENHDNVIWVHGGDTTALDKGVMPHVSAIVQGIQEIAPDQLHTAHCSRHLSALDCYDQPWLDINNTYSACDDSLGALQSDYAETPTLPLFYLEGKYENEGVDLDCLVDQHAWSIVSDAFGHVFGNSPIWKFGTGWEAQLGSAGAQAQTHLFDLFRSRAWFWFEPDLAGDVLVSNPGGDAAAARTQNGETVMVHVPSARTISVDLAEVSGSGVQGWWYDPTDASVTDLGLLPASGVSDFVAPGQRVLVLDDADKALPPPGQQVYVLVPTVPVAGPSLLGSVAALLVCVGWLALVGRAART